VHAQLAAVGLYGRLICPAAPWLPASVSSTPAGGPCVVFHLGRRRSPSDVARGPCFALPRLPCLFSPVLGLPLRCALSVAQPPTRPTVPCSGSRRRLLLVAPRCSTPGFLGAPWFVPARRRFGFRSLARAFCSLFFVGAVLCFTRARASWPAHPRPFCRFSCFASTLSSSARCSRVRCLPDRAFRHPGRCLPLLSYLLAFCSGAPAAAISPGHVDLAVRSVACRSLRRAPAIAYRLLGPLADHRRVAVSTRALHLLRPLPFALPLCPASPSGPLGSIGLDLLASFVCVASSGTRPRRDAFAAVRPGFASSR